MSPAKKTQTEVLEDLFFQIGKALATLPPERHQTYLERLLIELSANYDGVKYADALKEVYTGKLAKALENNNPKNAIEELKRANLKIAFFKGYESASNETKAELPNETTAQIKRS